MKKILALILVAVMMLSLAACAKEYVDPYEGLEYDEVSEKLYNEILGDFKAAYDAAKAETNVSKRYALMAIAEAELMASATMLPLSSNGGNYAISRAVPNTATSVLWGNDSYRYHDILVCTTPLTSADRAEVKALWAAKKGTGTFEAEVKALLATKGYTLKDSYTIGYSSDPKTWDVLATSRAADSEAIVNLYDGLYEYDMENRLMPALASGYTVSDDGLKYTFTIKSGLKWVDSQGNEVASVKADDFVAGMQHMMDAQGGLEYLVQGVIINATEYINGDVTDFAEVGVKAINDTTLEYTLVQPTPYFMTMLGYGVFAPMSRTYYEAKGGKFGAEYDVKAETYNYGKTPNDIAYCGPYTVSNFTSKNTIVFTANEKYWDAANINAKTITWLYNDGTDTTKSYNDMKAGLIDGAGLNTNTVPLAKADKVEGTDKSWFDTYHYVSATDATSFCAFYNINRTQFANANDATKAVSTLTAEEHQRATAAMRNVHFRRAVSFSLDRATYNEQTVGADLKLTSLRNSYTPGTFVTLAESVTVKIGGADKTYAAGTFYGQIMQDQLDAMNVKIKVWDPTADGGIGSSDGFDGWYNVENAVAELNIAIEELEAEGIAISKRNPIKIEVPLYSGSDIYSARAQAFKQSLETALDGKVQLVLVDCPIIDDWYYAGYQTNYGYEANYDIYDVSGWGPDYGDPQTYLDTFLPDYAGYMVKCIGIY